MALKKDHPEAFRKLRDAQRLVSQAVVGGLLEDLGAHVSHYRGRVSWRLHAGSDPSREACRRFRLLVPEGIRVLWEEGDAAHEALLSVETGDGRLTARVGALRGMTKYAEG